MGYSTSNGELWGTHEQVKRTTLDVRRLRGVLSRGAVVAASMTLRQRYRALLRLRVKVARRELIAALLALKHLGPK